MAQHSGCSPGLISSPTPSNPSRRIFSSQVKAPDTQKSAAGDGWVIRAGRRLFLVALRDGAAAASAVQNLIGSEKKAVPYIEAPKFHLDRRGMKRGEIFELGERRFKYRSVS